MSLSSAADTLLCLWLDSTQSRREWYWPGWLAACGASCSRPLISGAREVESQQRASRALLCLLNPFRGSLGVRWRNIMAWVKESFGLSLCSAGSSATAHSRNALVLRPNLEASHPNLSLNLRLVYCNFSSLSSIMDCRRSYSLKRDALWWICNDSRECQTVLSDTSVKSKLL